MITAPLAPGPRRWHHALVLGKFFPPHAGHHHLIDVAAGAAEAVTVLVAASTAEVGMTLDQRVAALAATHPGVDVVGCTDDVEVDFDDPAVWDAHLAAWAPALAGRRFDVVLGSEGYVEELAARLGAEPWLVDPARAAFPVSGSEVRADPLGHWEHLSTTTRAVLARRVVVLGAESTGTTTVSRALTERLRGRGGPLGATGWVGELGRDYTWTKLHAAGGAVDDLDWTDDDLVACAAGQTARIGAAASLGPAVVVADTDALATVCWSRRYLDRVPAGVVTAVVPVHLYLLTDHVGVPFVQDGIRDGEAVRASMTGWFADELDRAGVRWRWLRGPLGERVGAAVGAVDEVLAEPWFSTPPEYACVPVADADRLRWCVARLGADRVAAALGVAAAEVRLAAARLGPLPASPARIAGLAEALG